MQIRLAGFGGQGVILAGVILGDAAAIEGLNVIQTQDYGSQSRGGHSIADLIISKDPIYDLIVTKADVLLALAQLGYDSTKESLREGGLLIVDTELVQPDREFTGAPFTRIAEEEVGLALTVNMVALGYLVAKTNIVKKESVEEAIRRRVPKGTEEINLKAFRIGYEEGTK
ncbi:2-oxoacid:ferredoxin oxidoreductase subunit gamma [Thermococcus sp.]|uniref:2-oxoacid:ferredoxin oxidoreductase subunit gamma n=1 Tax=Thermococcus sp. TaxID=35749 RepID=UPI000F1D806B|nr:2-oxoacid:ferredoxin oxidoreductase subunit gamma [Thermococcus sp.]RLF79571.1 MAG: 2-oxoacid:ferredoxin oxidoreductase subunit gamma [Thermococci archaeon]MCD6144181.1 2-oxoacid:ferredoxin oxidoreductase subunit gamma [Thermococcus sp.]RLF84555.1 MAG: 2-oxoacid:ferredoxin oxidoreductase subunit gamma [Thermococci archaeon]RLF84767.1 MAG: 2-oxoacid:ferredoxin oxidoreductase subunit gamma [Thermococci archaeon]HDG63914.1 2-oxoacid:ferredoxin oxidoreductase subunit gamma [Thermococcus sp.]